MHLASAQLLHHASPAAVPLMPLADWVEYALALPPDADLTDPAATMPWWRWHCLDVWAVVCAALLACLAVVATALRAVWTLVCRAFAAKAVVAASNGKKES